MWFEEDGLRIGPPVFARRSEGSAGACDCCRAWVVGVKEGLRP